LLKEAQRDKEVSEDKLIEYTDTMVRQRRRKRLFVQLSGSSSRPVEIYYLKKLGALLDVGRSSNNRFIDFA